MNMKVDLCGVTLNNPVMTASGIWFRRRVCRVCGSE